MTLIEKKSKEVPKISEEDK